MIDDINIEDLAHIECGACGSITAGSNEMKINNKLYQLTQDLATAQAEIARLREGLTEIAELRSTTTNFGVARAMAKLALSQSSPSLALTKEVGENK